MFYNGTDRDVPDRTELRLSDAFENPMQDPALELKVTMLNINAGHNEELMNNCHVLWEYAEYVARVRKYAAEMSLHEAVELAITECINEGILTEFLQHNRAEVYKVSIFEYDKEKEEKKLRKAERECGREEGLQQGLQEGLKEGLKEGLQQGRMEERKSLLALIAKMSAGGDADQIATLDDPEVMNAMQEKYGIR